MFDPDDKSVVCAKGVKYETTLPTEFEYKSGLILWVVLDDCQKIPLTINIFDKYFTTIDEMRNYKINEVLK